MTDNVTNELIFVRLKTIQTELAAARDRDDEMLCHLGAVETIVARISRDMGQFVSDQVGDRIERIERRLRIERLV